MFASVVGGDNVFDRKKAGEAAAQQAGLAGFSFVGFGLGEAPEVRASLLTAAMAPLPPGLPRSGTNLYSTYLPSVSIPTTRLPTA
jgi:hypothetical protein